MSKLTTFSIVFVLIALPALPALAREQVPLPAVDQIAAMKALASAVPLGSRVKLQIREGRRMTATLMQVTEEGIVVQRVARIPESPVTIRFGELATLQREEKGGFSLGKAVGIGLAAGVGAILTMFAIAFSISD